MKKKKKSKCTKKKIRFRLRAYLLVSIHYIASVSAPTIALIPIKKSKCSKNFSFKGLFCCTHWLYSQNIREMYQKKLRFRLRAYLLVSIHYIASVSAPTIALIPIKKSKCSKNFSFKGLFSCTHWLYSHENNCAGVNR